MLGDRTPSRSDYMVAGVALALGLFGTIVSPEEAGIAAMALVVAQTAPLIYRRHAPGAVLAMVVAATIAYFAIAAPFVTTAFLGLMIALYALAAYGSERASRIGAGGTAGAVIGLFAFDAVLGRDVNAVDAFVYLGLAGVAWVLGDRARTRQAYTRFLEERTEQAERARAIEAAAAAAAERTRIARELHDVVAHSVSTMVLHASAAKQVLEGGPTAARDSLDLIEDIGRGAVGELRTILQVLRAEEDDEEGGDLRPQPGVAAIGDLADRTRAAGIGTEVKVEGIARRLPSSVDLSAFRIVQEALTNVIKHSGAQRAEVVVRFSDDHLLLHITDDGLGPGERPGSGFGLAGMRERVELLGGRIQAGGRPKGGFEVLAVLPFGGDGR